MFKSYSDYRFSEANSSLQSQLIPARRRNYFESERSFLSAFTDTQIKKCFQFDRNNLKQAYLKLNGEKHELIFTVLPKKIT